MTSRRADVADGMVLASDLRVYGPGNVRPHRYRFDPADPAFVSRDASGLVTFRLLAPGDAEEGIVLVRGASGVLGYPLERIGAAGSLSLWEAKLRPATTRLEYAVALRLEGDVPVYISPTGITNAVERLDRFTLDVADLAVHDVPEWVTGAVMYQIFPERFASGDPSLDPPGAAPWHAAPTRHGFHGGDLPGIAGNVDHLVELSVDVVYLNPVFTSPSNHRYDTVDYYDVDPTLGGDDALRALVNALHERGIRVILDASFNHCHPRFFAFADLVTRGPDSPYAGWFVVHDWPVRVRYRPHLVEPGSRWGVRLDRLRRESGVPVEATTGDGPAVEPLYDSWYGVPLMPRVNLANPDARRYMLDVASYWIREFDVDGWRMDVVRYVDHDFWSDMRCAVRAVKPDAYLLAEVMGDARRWLAGDEFDGVMNYTFRQLAVDYFATGSIDTPTFLEGLLELAAMYSPAASAANQNLIGSHDTPRFLTLAGGDERMLLLATLLQATLPGIAALYYGDELAMEGGDDPDNRRGMDWSAAGSAHHAAVIDLLRLRRRHPALRRGDWRLVARDGDAFAFERRLGGDRVLAAMNRGLRPALLPSLPVPGPAPVWVVGDARATAAGIRIGPRSGAVFSAP